MSNPPPLYPGEFLRVVAGSTVHGLAVPGTDDTDLYGICIPPPEEVLGMGKPFEQHVFRTQPEGHPSGPGDIDLTVYSLQKFLRLASSGNPTILNLLFVPPAFQYLNTSLANELRALTPLIVSKEAGARYLGYMQSQRERLLGLRGQKRDGYTRRLKYMSDAGWDTKYAMHLNRLAVQGIELLQTGHITLPIPKTQRETLLNIRKGLISLQEVIDYSYELESMLKKAIDTSPLPAHPDRDKLDMWMIDTYLAEWENQGDPWTQMNF